MATDDRPVIDYYSDMLCVWAWIAQPRLEEVRERWGSRIVIRERFIDVFGAAHEKILKQWGDADGFERFGSHVLEAGAAHPHAQLHEGLWKSVRPQGSWSAHLWVKAAALAGDETDGARLAAAIRRAFFVDGRDISDTAVLDEVAQSLDLDADALSAALGTGQALAALAADLKAAQAAHVHGSPTWVMNQGRQLLYGNVGYRIIDANLQEFLDGAPGGASWC